MCTVQFTTFGVYQVMLKLDENKATGPDGLSPCAHEFAPSLTFLFNFTLSVANSCAMFTKGLTRCLNRFKDSMITIVSSMK